MIVSFLLLRVVVVVQLVERFLPTPQVPGSNLDIGKNYIKHCLTSALLKRRTLRKRGREWPIKNFLLASSSFFCCRQPKTNFLSCSPYPCSSGYFVLILVIFGHQYHQYHQLPVFYWVLYFPSIVQLIGLCIKLDYLS